MSSDEQKPDDGPKVAALAFALGSAVTALHMVRSEIVHDSEGSKAARRALDLAQTVMEQITGLA